MFNTKRILAGAIALMVTTSVFAATGVVVSTSTTTATPTANKMALPAPENLRIVSKTNTTVTLEWDKVSGATSYFVKYDKKSVAESKDPLAQYNEETDTIYSTGKVVDKLTPDTMYYFAVVSLDDKMLESEKFSKEVSVKTDAANAVAGTGATVTTTTTTTTTATGATDTQKGPALAIARIGVIDNKSLTVLFNNDLGTDPVTVRIRNTKDNSDIGVAMSTVDVLNKKQVNVKLSMNLDPSVAYSLTVLAAKDINGTNIQNGVDGVKDFTTAADLALSPEALTATNTATGATGSGATATELPKTGAGQNLIIIASLLIAGAMVYVYRARKA